MHFIFPADPRGDFGIHVSYRCSFQAGNPQEMAPQLVWERLQIRRAGNIWQPALPRTELSTSMRGIQRSINNPIVDVPMGVMFSGQIQEFPNIGMFTTACTPAVFYQGDMAVAVHKNPSMDWNQILQASGLDLNAPIDLFSSNNGQVLEEIHGIIPNLQLVDAGGFPANGEFNIQLRQEIINPQIPQEGGPPEVQEGGPPEIQGGGPPEVQEGGPPEVQEGGPPEVQEGGPPEVQGGGPPEVQAGGPPENQGGGPPIEGAFEPPVEGPG